MLVALIDNGSANAAAHRQLRAIAAALSERVGIKVEAVSWKHSHRVPDSSLQGAPAHLLVPWMRAQLARGERDYLFVPFFVSPRGAVGLALRQTLERLRREEGDFTFAFTEGLATRGAVADIVESRIRATISDHALRAPAVIVVDHGGPSPDSGKLRDAIAAEIRGRFASSLRGLVAASMQGDAHPHNRPLLADALAVPDFARGDVIIAPLFLAPGRHAGADGDLARIVQSTQSRETGAARRCFFTELVGTHPQVVDTLAAGLREALAARSALSPNLPPASLG